MKDMVQTVIRGGGRGWGRGGHRDKYMAVLNIPWSILMPEITPGTQICMQTMP